MLEVLYHHVEFGGARTSPTTRVDKTFSFCLSVCVPVMILNDIVCVHDFTMKPLEYKNDFDTVGDGKVCSCAPF